MGLEKYLTGTSLYYCNDLAISSFPAPPHDCYELAMSYDKSYPATPKLFVDEFSRGSDITSSNYPPLIYDMERTAGRAAFSSTELSQLQSTVVETQLYLAQLESVHSFL